MYCVRRGVLTHVNNQREKIMCSANFIRIFNQQGMVHEAFSFDLSSSTNLSLPFRISRPPCTINASAGNLSRVQRNESSISLSVHRPEESLKNQPSQRQKTLPQVPSLGISPRRYRRPSLLNSQDESSRVCTKIHVVPR